jgi:hypothetical protein
VLEWPQSRARHGRAGRRDQRSRVTRVVGAARSSITSRTPGRRSGPYGGNQTVFRFILTNSHCMRVRIITYGATVQSISVPDRHGHLANVALGFKTLESTSTWTACHQGRQVLAVPTSARPSAGTPTGSGAPRSS